MDLIITLDVVFAVLAGASGYLLTRRDLSRRSAVLVGVGCAVMVGLSFLFVVYLAVFAFIAAAVAYLVLGRRLSAKQSLAASATAFTGMLAASVVVMSFALSSM